MCAVFDSDEWGDSGFWARAFPNQVNGMFGKNGCCRPADIKDGTSSTLMVGEVTGAGKGTHFGAHWIGDNALATRDGINGPNTIQGGKWGGVDPPTILGSFLMGFGSFHPGGCNFVLADGSVQFLSQNISQDVLRALTTRDGPSLASNPLHNWQEIALQQGFCS
jgi:prepilin-type processing-associated H-X9-DG protein